MSASREELEQCLRSNVECMTELLIRGHMTKTELLDRVSEILTELGWMD